MCSCGIDASWWALVILLVMFAIAAWTYPTLVFIDHVTRKRAMRRRNVTKTVGDH